MRFKDPRMAAAGVGGQTELKGTVSRDFSCWVYFTKQLIPVPLEIRDRLRGACDTTESFSNAIITQKKVREKKIETVLGYL